MTRFFKLAALFGLVILTSACKMPAETGKKISASDDKQVKEQAGTTEVTVKTDSESIEKGENLFKSKCSFCHKANSTETIASPGLKGILKNSRLPVSRRPATPENIAGQLKNPYKDMPSFSYLPEEDVLNIIAYLNTL